MGKYVHAGVGISKANDPAQAGKEAVEMALEKMKKDGGKKPTFGLLFCSGGKYGKNDKTIKKLVDGAHSVFKDTPWIGCTTAGEIVDSNVMRGSVTALVLDSEYIKFGTGVSENVKENAFNAGKLATRKALDNIKIDKYVDSYLTFLATKNKPPRQLIRQRQFIALVLGAGFTIKESGWEDEMIEGIKDVIGDYTPIVGGSAGDDGRLLRNYQFINGQVYENSVIVTIIFSNLKIGFGISHGFKPTDKIALVTKAENRTVYELNGREAAEVYAELIGIPKKELLKGAGSLKLGQKLSFVIGLLDSIGVKKEEMMKKINILKFMTENPFGIMDVHGNYWTKVPKTIVDGKYIEFYNKVLKGTPLVLLKIDEDLSLRATTKSVHASKEGFNYKPAITIVFECGGRAVYLGKDIGKSVALAKKESNKLIGFYTYAEYGLSKNMPSGTHYYTCVSFSISDELLTQ